MKKPVHLLPVSMQPNQSERDISTISIHPLRPPRPPHPPSNPPSGEGARHQVHVIIPPDNNLLNIPIRATASNWLRLQVSFTLKSDRSLSGVSLYLSLFLTRPLTGSSWLWISFLLYELSCLHHSAFRTDSSFPHQQPTSASFLWLCLFFVWQKISPHWCFEFYYIKLKNVKRVKCKMYVLLFLPLVYNDKSKCTTLTGENYSDRDFSFNVNVVTLVWNQIWNYSYQDESIYSGAAAVQLLKLS